MAPQLRFDGRVVVITGAGSGIGKAHALFFASRGASVVVNDLGTSRTGEGSSPKPADEVVKAILAAGGKAVANHDSVLQGERIIQTALQAYGRIDVLINNAGIVRDASFEQMTDFDWDLALQTNLGGSFKCARAAWPHFRKQKFGRVINTTSIGGFFGVANRSNYTAAKAALIGFTETLAKEGAKYNIICNLIAPLAATPMADSIMRFDPIACSPDWVPPLFAVLAHSDNTSETGGIFEVAGGYMAKLRWERAEGLLLKPDESYTPGAILKQWNKVVDFSRPQHPTGPNDFLGLLEESMQMGPSPPGASISFAGKVVLVTGGGAGIGRAYCLAFARHGANVVVNDLANPDPVVDEITQLGARAVGVKASAEEGDVVVKAAIDAFGRIDIIINNAGILRDKAFANMDDNLWDSVLNVHLRGTYKVTKAAWPYFLRQKYGRILNTTSTSGIYGNFGQANYAAAKCAILGLSHTLALEGAEHGIYVNTIAPNAGTAMTATILPEEMVQAFKPDYIAPLVLALCSDSCPDPTDGLYEVGSGWCGRTRWQRSGGHRFPGPLPLLPEDVAQQWSKITDFDDGHAEYPTHLSDSLSKADPNWLENVKHLEAIAKALKTEGKPTEFRYDERDVVLYNIGIGAQPAELKYVFEGCDEFQVVPTYGVIPPFNAEPPFDYEALVPNFSPMMLLHGEQYLEIRKFPLPTSARLLSRARLVEVLDKGNAAVVKNGVTTVDANTGEDLFYNEMTVFLRGCGGFHGPSKGISRGPATASHTPPSRAPDAVAEVVTRRDQAAIYRLSGDYNPLHIDPDFAKMGGFSAPILHGLCTFGIAGKAIFDRFGPFKNIKVRFAGPVVPGQTVVTEMWRDRRAVVFRCTVKETGKRAIVDAAAELMDGARSHL